jgi:hypothetical protein
MPGVTQPIRTALDGPVVARQHRALAVGDFTVGCWECEVPARLGLRGTSLAAQFDRYASTASSAYPRIMDFALSNRCNLQCVMCNGDLSSAIRSQRERRPPLPAVYGDEFFAELVDFLPHLERAQFKGGEPFLSPENQRVWDLLLDLDASCEVSVTTNATIWNDRVEHYVRDLRMDVIVSVDGMTAPTLESIRVGVKADEFWANVDRFQQVTTETGSSLTLSWCLMPQNVDELGLFFAETSRRGCHANVIVVNQPPAHDMTGLDRERLGRIVGHLERERRETGAWLTADAGAAWDETIEVLRGHVDREIQLRPNHPFPELDEASPPIELTEARADLEAWAQAPPIVVRDWAGFIVAVESPEWAAWLRPEDWAGRQPSDLLGLLRVAVGREPNVSVKKVSNGVIEAWIVFRAPTETDPTAVVRSLTFPSPGPHDPYTTHLIASPDLQRG